MKTVLLLVVVLFFVSCSHKKHKQEIQQKVEQSQVKDPAALGVTIQEAIENSPNITAEEKTKLHAILAANKQKATELSEQSFKLRGVLIQELLSGNVDHKRIKIIKKKIKKVEADKLKNTFDTVEKITGVVSKNNDKSTFADPLIFMDRPYK